MFLFFFCTYHTRLRSLQWLRGPNKNVELELDTIRSNIQAAKLNERLMAASITTDKSLLNRDTFNTIYTNIKSVLKNARLVKPVMITCGLMVFQRFTGDYYLFNFSLHQIVFN